MNFNLRRLTGTLLLGAAAALFAAPPHAAAQQRQYRVLDLGTLPGGPPTRPYGINNDGAIVGEGKAANGAMHAFIWLPRTLYGGFCPVQSPYDLHVLAPSTPSGNSIGYEINKALLPGPTFPIEAAQIAGQVSGTNGDAFLWTLASGATTTTNLNTFSHPPVIIRTKAARSIADGTSTTSPVVVGDAVAEAICSNQPVATTIGFRTRLDGSNQLVALEGFQDDQLSTARDVNFVPQPPPGGGVGPLPDTVGYSEGTSNIAECVGLPGCDDERDSLLWRQNPAEPASLLKINAGLGGAQALGVNDAGDIVGSSMDTNGSGGCVYNATLWTGPNHTLVVPVLGDQPPLLVASQTFANAINNATLRQIVGRNATTEHASLWEQAPGGGWQPVLDLDTAACDCNNTFVLREALDINDSGWIVARGQVIAGGSEHAYLLRRVSDCPADLNGDGQVNSVDLDLLNGNLGACHPTACNDLCCGLPGVPDGCRGNLDGDCDVDRFDHMALVAAYGPCPGFGPPCAPEGGSAGFSIEQGLQALGFDSVGAYQSWLPAHSEAEAHAMGLALVALLSP